MMEMMQRWWRWKFGFSNPSSQSETEQWSNNDGDESLAIPLLSWETEQKLDPMMQRQAPRCIHWTLIYVARKWLWFMLFWLILIYVALKLQRWKYLPPCVWFMLLRNDLKWIKFAIFPQGKTKDGVDTKEIMKRRRERAICIVSALCTIKFHV